MNAVRFSPDGRHWAVIAQTATGSPFVIADGKKRLEYQRVENLGFLSDGRVFYRAGSAQGRQFVIIGDQESNGYQC